MRTATLKALAGLWLVLQVTAVEAKERVYYFHNDHLGTPQAISDEAGRKVWAADYEPFGKAVVNEDPDGDGRRVTNNLRFPGQYFDAETGLHYNYHRDYDPGTGRFTTKDPIGFAGGDTNLYAYVMNDPVNLVDPLGLYGDDTHFSVSYGGAVDAGFTERQSAIIGNACGQVDTVHDPFLPSNYLYHFSTNQQAWEMVDRASNLEELGTAIHILMDSFSHRGLGTLIESGAKHIVLKPDKFQPGSPRDAMMMREVERALFRYYSSGRPR